MSASTCGSVRVRASWCSSCHVPSRSSVGQSLGPLPIHDEAHDVFMTLPAYTSIREGEASQLGRGPKPCQGGPWSEEMPSIMWFMACSPGSGTYDCPARNEGVVCDEAIDSWYKWSEWWCCCGASLGGLE